MINSVKQIFKGIVQLREDNKITVNQYKGLMLEMPTYLALEQLGIKPIPLHNPFDENYAKDYHLSVDLLFFNNGLLYGVECKNISPKLYLTADWIKEEIEERFNNMKGIVSINRKVVVTSAHKRTLLRYLSDDYDILELGFQANLWNISDAIFSLNNLILSLLQENKTTTIVNTIHGYKQYYDKLKYIQTRLREDYVKEMIL